MKRRQFITLLGGAAAWPLAVRAQGKVPVIGYLSSKSAEPDMPMLAAFRQGLAATGHVEGRNVAIELRFTDGDSDRVPVLATELVRRRPAVAVAVGGREAAAAGALDARIPVVFVVAVDPVRLGFVTSFNRPTKSARCGHHGQQEIAGCADIPRARFRHAGHAQIA